MNILHHLPQSRLSTVSRDWLGDTVVVLGGGPSLTPDDVALAWDAHRAGQVKAIAVNNAYMIAPWAEVCYFADSHWWVWHKDRVEFLSFSGQRCSISNSGANITDLTVHILRNAHGDNLGFGLSLDPGTLVTGRNSGFQALNLAVLAGARRVLLLGFDGQPNAAGKTHWFGAHPRPTPVAAYEHYRRAMSEAERALTDAGVRVIQCSPGSAINSFEKMPLEAALALLGQPIGGASSVAPARSPPVLEVSA